MGCGDYLNDLQTIFRRPIDDIPLIRVGHKKSPLVSLSGEIVMVIPLGLEPKTYCLEGSCSIQLSYGTDLKKVISAEIGCKGTYIFANFQIFGLLLHFFRL